MSESKPLSTHDVRQSAYRGNGPDAGESGVPSGKERHDPSAQPGHDDEDAFHSRGYAQGGHGPDGVAGQGRTGYGVDADDSTQPNFGQAGTYAKTGEHADGAKGTDASPGEYHVDRGGSPDADSSEAEAGKAKRDKPD
jgi:hypothetical protein